MKMNVKDYKKKILYAAVNVIFIPLIVPFYILNNFFKIKIWRMRSSRIGHLACNTELFLRRINLGMVNRNFKHIGLATKEVANEQLLKMFKRKLKIIQIPRSKYFQTFTKILANNSLLGKLGLFQEMPFTTNDYYEFNNAKPNLSFNEDEKKKGGEILQKTGVGNNWFVCFHARDPAYLNSLWKGGDGYHSIRNTTIENYLKAVDYVTKQGGYALRMGAKVEKKMPVLNNDKIIDYASKFRTDFGDVYLPANCKFFLSDGAGISQVSCIFNIPIATVNVTFLGVPPFGKNDLFIPKRMWNEKKKRYLSLKEMVTFSGKSFAEFKNLEKEGIFLIENTPREILDLTIEMNERLEGTWKTTEEDEELQKKFKSLFKEGMRSYGFPSRIGAKFLRENKHLLL